MNEFTPKVVLVVAAHADDNEFCFGGSIAKWISQGATVHYLIITDGRRGTASADEDQSVLVGMRQAEQRAAADVLGVDTVTCLDYEDGRMELTWDLKKDIVKKIRELKPDTVLCMDPTFVYSDDYNYVNHNDHRIVGQATFDAVYPLARDETAFDDLKDVEPHKTRNLVMYNLNNESEYIDITDTIDKKVEAISAHQSQFSDPTFISNMIRDYAERCAKKNNSEGFAEGFVRLTLD